MSESTLARTGLELHRAYDTPLRRFQVLGERASGTNYLHALVQMNLGLAPSAHLGWKHGFPQAQFYPRDMLVIVCLRGLVPWLRSMYRKPWHADASLRGIPFPEFLRAEWRTAMDPDLWWDDRHNEMMLEPPSRWMPGLLCDRLMIRIGNRLGRPRRLRQLSPQAQEIALGTPLQYDRDPVTGEAFANVLRLRSAKARAYLGHRNRVCNLAIVQYEAVKADPDRLLGAIAEGFGLAWRGPHRPVGAWMGELTATQDDAGHVPPDQIAPEDMAFIRAEADAEVERAMGYAPP